MIKQNQRENVNLPPKQEGNYTTTTTTSRPWSGLRNPRIVRVSRAFGGKDRHSKVSTVKGLRDRRVRLSVPTAIQLYDLQDKLGLNQPSKVVDWLINKAQNEIDKLPPLQFPVHENSNFASHEDIGATNYKPNGKGLLPTFPQSTHPKHGEVDLNESVVAINKGNEPYTSYYQWEQAANAYLSQLGIIRAPTHQPDTLNIIPSSMSLLPDHSQMVSLCSPKIVPPLMFGPTFGEFDGSSASQNPHYFSEN